MSRLLRIGVTSLALLFAPWSAKAQTNVATPAAEYGEFFSERPPDLDQITLPPAARDVIVAKVCFVTFPYWRGGRHSAHPKDTLGAEVQIVDILKGEAAAGARLHVGFLPRGVPGHFTYPNTPRQRKLNYFIVSYVDGDNDRRLIVRPLSQERYEEWDKERWAHVRERGRPGAQDERWVSPCRG